MKILFISDRPFGQFGTSGTYKFIETVSKFHEVVAIVRKSNDIITVYDRKPFGVIFVDEVFPLENLNSTIKNNIDTFEPDIVYVFNFPTCFKVIERIADNTKHKIIFDIKTPLLMYNDPEQKESIQDDGRRVSNLIDCVVTLNKNIVNTWISNYIGKIHEYPLGFDSQSIKKKKSFRKKPKKFVFFGTLHPLRKVEELIDGFKRYSKFFPEAKLDIIGWGNPQYITKLKSKSIGYPINFLGLLKQKQIFNKLSSYDVGIIWVPKETFDDSPSLKMLEAVSSGITIAATNTTAHKKLVNNRNIKVDFFNDNQKMLCDCLWHISMLTEEESQRNIRNINIFDYDNVFENYFHKLFEELKNGM